MTTLAPPSRRCAVCRAFLRSTNPDDVCDPCQAQARIVALPADLPQRLTDRVHALVARSDGLNKDDLAELLPEVSRKALGGALCSLLRHGRITGVGRHGGGKRGAQRVYRLPQDRQA